MRNIGLCKTQAGFTLIELMVVLAISSVLMLAIMQNFIASKKAYRLDEGLALLQENGRFSTEVLSRSIRMAGFRNDLAITSAGAFPADATFAANGQVIVGTNDDAVAGDNVLDGTDTITVRLLGNNEGTTTDCLGAAVPAGVEAVNTFYVSDSAVTGTDTNELHCRSNLGDQPIADGVDDMQILYGIDTNNTRTAATYLDAAQVNAAGVWGSVVSVRISLLYNTVNPATTITTRRYVLLGNAPKPFTDALQRQVFTSTIGLRNLIP